MKKIILLVFILISTVKMPERLIGYSKTFADVQQFLLYDDTHLHQWTPEFDCVQFSEMMVEHARENSFVSVIVSLQYQLPYDGYTGHDIVAFYTVDKGIVWVEPQNNLIYSDDLIDHAIHYLNAWYLDPPDCLRYTFSILCNSVPIVNYTYLMN